MTSIHDLPAVIAKLAHIDQAGLLDDLEYEVADACRGPADPLDRYPHHRYTVERYARVASRVLGLPYADCQRAALEAVLPSTKLRIALATIAEYHDRLQQEAVQDFARAKLARERRRLRA